MVTAHFHPSAFSSLNNNDTDSVLMSNPKQQDRVLHSNEENPNRQYLTASTATEKMETATLAEELSALRKKMERLRLDKEKTEKMLKERDSLLHLQMKEMEERGQIQTHLEIQVDRLFRLKEIKSYCMRISPLKSLRERQRDGTRWHSNQLSSLDIKEDENPWQSSTPSTASRVIRVNND